MQRADEAMYAANRDGKACCRVWRPAGAERITP
jgi:hypothetical protein